MYCSALWAGGLVVRDALSLGSISRDQDKTGWACGAGARSAGEGLMWWCSGVCSGLQACKGEVWLDAVAQLCVLRLSDLQGGGQVGCGGAAVCAQAHRPVRGRSCRMRTTPLCVLVQAPNPPLRLLGADAARSGARGCSLHSGLAGAPCTVSGWVLSALCAGWVLSVAGCSLRLGALCTAGGCSLHHLSGFSLRGGGALYTAAALYTVRRWVCSLRRPRVGARARALLSPHIGHG